MGLFEFIDKLLGKVKKKQQEKVPAEKIFSNETDILKERSAKQTVVSCEMLPVTIDNCEKVKKRFIAVDFETTGLNPYLNRIIEIGAVIFQGGTIIDRFDTFVDPGIHIPESASRINHITNDMVKGAPKEEDAIKDLVSFIGNAIKGETVLCAHNANFDAQFLSSALKRCGVDSNLIFCDTLAESRKCVYGLENYKLETLASHFSISNNSAHRAANDAEVCGLILLNLCNILIEKDQRKEKERERKTETCALSDVQKEWCAYIQNKLSEKDLNLDRLTFRRGSRNVVYCEYIFGFLKIKFGKRTYVIVKKDSFKKNDFVTEECPASEGGDQYLRVFFEKPFDLDAFLPNIVAAFSKIYENVQREIKDGKLNEKKIESYSEFSTKIMPEEVHALLESARKRLEGEQVKKEKTNHVKDKKTQASLKKLQPKEQKESKKKIKTGDSKSPRSRAVCRLDDNGTVLEEYDSISEAVSKSGVNSKSIRNAANGIQKHAGGYCWKFKETMDGQS